MGGILSALRMGDLMKDNFGTFDPAVAVDFVKKFEGCKLEAYRCPAGVWTIGVGHTEGVQSGDTITQAEADKLLEGDLRKIAAALNPYVNVPVTKGMYIALISLAFNVGPAAVKKSTLLLRLNHGDYAAAADEFPKWSFANGVLMPGLKRRRQAERELFEKDL